MEINMNKKGNIYFGVVIAIMIWVAGIMIMPFIINDIDTYRVDMDCSNSSISDFTKINCLAGDSLIPYFIWTLAVIALSLLVGSRQ